MRTGTCCHCPTTPTGTARPDVELNEFGLCRRCAPGPTMADTDPRIYSTAYETELGDPGLPVDRDG